MDSKSLVLTEQFSFSLFSKRKLLSGFVLGLAVSLFIFSLIFLTSPGKSSRTTLFPNQSWFNSTSSVHSSLVSWFFPPPSVEISSNSSSELQRHEEKGVLENTHILNFSQSDQNRSFSSNSSSELQKHEEKTVFENTHIVNFSLSDQNKSFSSNSSSELQKHEENTVLENTHIVNFSQSGQNESFSSNSSSELQKHEEKTVLENTHVVNFSQSDQNKSFSSNSSSELQKHEEKTVLENTQVVNFFQSDQHASFSGKCDIFSGKWVRDERKPYYPAGSCPYIDLPFDCNTNGRPDHEFEKWRWQPNDCEIPRFNGTDFLERLRGKRLTFVGDSINRNAWQSLVCLLRHDIKNKKRVYEISGRKEFKTLGIYSFRYKDYNCSVEFVRTPFLVREMFIKGGNGSEDETLRLDLMDKTTSKYKDANIIIFNTGHWWTHEKPSRGNDYYQEGKYVYPMLNVKEAYKKALTTWAKWVDKHIDAKKTHIIFRGYSVTHFRGRQWNSGGQCHKETEPIFNESYLAKYPSKMTTLESVLKQMATPVIYLNISKLTDYRKDAHPSIYKMAYQTVEELVAAEKTPDCSHWCLPGVPDIWNELLYAALLMKGWGSEEA